MAQRIVSLWFPHLMTDWMLRRQPHLQKTAFVLARQEQNRRVIKAVNQQAKSRGVLAGMVVADCMALIPGLQVFEFDPAQTPKLLNALGEWCMRYSPVVAIDQDDGLLLDASGCAHLWGGEENYLHDIRTRLSRYGYTIHCAMADTIGAAWAICRFGKKGSIVGPGEESEHLSPLHPAALRLDPAITDRLIRLGLVTIGHFMNMPRTALRRRFGQACLSRLDQALGMELELPEPLRPLSPHQERLPCPEPVCTAPGIEMALLHLLDALCLRLHRENKGLRQCSLYCYRIDGNMQHISIGTNRPSRNTKHLLRLFADSISTLEPGLGFELFLLEAPVVEELTGIQDVLWSAGHADEAAFAELLDRLAGKTGGEIAHYLPAEHYWPEHSVKASTAVGEKPLTSWRSDLPRPLHLLSEPEPIEAVVPVPDYPPLMFIYKKERHTVKKADGPERIEQEWWRQAGLYRDYYCVEDEAGRRYWLFRAGDNTGGQAKWFLHGFFS